MPLPRRTQFESNLLGRDPGTGPAVLWAYGDLVGPDNSYYIGWPGWATFVTGPTAPIDNEYYYDACRAFYGIADYTNDPQWTTIARRALTQFYLPLVESNPAFNNVPPDGEAVSYLHEFPWGPYLDWQRNPDATARARARQVLFALANNRNYGWSYQPELADIIFVREVSYTLISKFLAVKAGFASVYGFEPWGLTDGNTLYGQAFIIANQAIDLLNGGTGGVVDSHQYVRPFMMGNLFEAMSLLWEYNGDSRVVPTMTTLFDKLWAICFRPNGVTSDNTLPDGVTPAPALNLTYGYNSFTYTDRLSVPGGDNSLLGANSLPPNVWAQLDGQTSWSPNRESALWPTPELNGLILPAYFWLYQRTGNTLWRDRADLLFDGLVQCGLPGAIWGANQPTGQGTQNQGKTFNQMYTRIWPYVLDAVGTTTPPPPTAFTSVQSGNWTDPATWGVTSGFPTSGNTATIAATHQVTLTANAIVGQHLTDESDALAIHGTLNLNGFQLLLLGPCSCFAEGINGRTSITGGPNSTIAIDSVPGRRYWINLQNTVCQLTGTAAQPCAIASTTQANQAALYSSNQFDGFLLTYTFLTDLVDVDNHLLGQEPFANGFGSGNHVLDHCHFVRCGCWAQNVGTLTMTNCTFQNTVGGACVDYRASNTDNPILRNNVFDQWVGSTTKGHYTGNMFLGNFLTWIDFGPTAESTNNFIRATGTNCINLQGVHTETALVYDDDLVNPHLCPTTTNATITGWAIASTGLDNNGDGFIGPVGTNVLRGNLFLRNAASEGFVTFVNLINSQSGATVSFTHNTCIGFGSVTWGIVSEADANFPGILAAVKDNIFYATTPNLGFAVTFQTTRSVTDAGLAQNLDYNDTYLNGTSTVYDQNGANPTTVRGYDNLQFTNGALPGLHDQNADPRFVELRDPVFYDQSVFGLHANPWAVGQVYQPGQQVYHASSSYWNNRAANFTCILSTSGTADSITEPMLGTNWRLYWRYTVFYQLSRMNEGDYDPHFSTAAILAWLRGGYVPQNATLHAASDGSWMGAQTGQSADLFRQEESAGWLAQAGTAFLLSEQRNPLPKLTVVPIPTDASLVFWSVRSQTSRADTPSLGPSELYTLNPAGQATQITFNHLQSYEHVAVSPDHKLIASDRYLSGGSGNVGLYVTDIANKRETRLLSSFYSVGNGGVDWDSNGFIYCSGQQVVNGPRDIWKVRPDGTGLVNLTNAGPTNVGEHFDVGVSEDNTLVSYTKMLTVTLNGVTGLKTQSWVMNIDGTNQRMVYDGGPGIGTMAGFPWGSYDPEVSPDSTQLVFSRTNPNFVNFPNALNMAQDIYTIKLDGTGLTLVTVPGPCCVIPDWHGSKIIYTEYNEAANFVGLVSINPDGTGRTPLETLPRVWDGGQNGKFIALGAPLQAAQGAPLAPAAVNQTVAPAKRQVQIASLAQLQGYIAGTFTSKMTWGDDVVLALGNYGAPASSLQLPAASTILGTQTGNDYITFRTANLASLPPNGARVTAADHVNMPTLTSPPGDFLFRMPTGLDHVRFIGLHVLGSPTQVCGGILLQSDTPATLANVHHCLVDRCSIEGDAVQGCNEGVQGAGSHLAVTGCRFRNCFHPGGGEPHDILFASGHGPYLVENNDIEVACIGLFVGDSSVDIPGVVPADITVRRNLFYKPDKWNYYKYLYNTGTATIAADGSTATIVGGVVSATWLDGQTYFAPTNTANQGTFAGQPATSRLITAIAGQVLTLTPAWPDDGSRGQSNVPYRITNYNGNRIIAIQFKNLYESKHSERVLHESNTYLGATQDAQSVQIQLASTRGSGGFNRDIVFQNNYVRACANGLGVTTRSTGGLNSSFQNATLTKNLADGLYKVTCNATTGVNTGDTVILAGFVKATTANGRWAATRIDNLSFTIPVAWVVDDSCGFQGNVGSIVTFQSGGVTKRVTILNNVFEDVGDFMHGANSGLNALSINVQPVLIPSDAALSDTGDWYVDDIRIEHNTIVSPNDTVATPSWQIRMLWCLTPTSPESTPFTSFWQGRRWTIRNNVGKIAIPASSAGPAMVQMTNESQGTGSVFWDSDALNHMTDAATRVYQYNAGYSPWNNGDVASEYAALTGPEAFPANSVQVDVTHMGFTAPTVAALASYVLQPVYATGTATVTAGSATVTFSGSLPTTVAKGTPFKLTADNVFYVVLSRDSATQVTLDRVYTGTTQTGAFKLGYQGWSSDGTDPGADIPTLTSLTRGCLTGVWT